MYNRVVDVQNNKTGTLNTVYLIYNNASTAQYRYAVELKSNTTNIVWAMLVDTLDQAQSLSKKINGFIAIGPGQGPGKQDLFNVNLYLRQNAKAPFQQIYAVFT
jgi:hypothetical protein